MSLDLEHVCIQTIVNQNTRGPLYRVTGQSYPESWININSTTVELENSNYANGLSAHDLQRFNVPQLGLVIMSVQLGMWVRLDIFTIETAETQLIIEAYRFA